MSQIEEPQPPVAKELSQPAREMTVGELNSQVEALCIEIFDLKEEVKALRNEVNAMSVTMSDISENSVRKK